MKKHFKRILALALSVMTCMGMFTAFSLTASAASAEVYMLQLPRGEDPNRSGWGHPSMTFVNGWRSGSSEHVTIKSIGTYEADTVYCIEPGVPLNVGNTLNQKGEDFWDDYPENLNSTLSSDQIKTFIGHIFVYGWGALRFYRLCRTLAFRSAETT